MKALLADEGNLEWVERPPLSRAVGEVRIKVVAAGLNRADLLQRAGFYPPPCGVTDVIGLECAGIVVESDADGIWQPGERVCSLLAGGGMAEEVVVDARHVLPVPDPLSLAEAAVLPEVYATAWSNLFRLAAVQPGEKVLLHAGASGVGSAGIQLCKVFGNPCWVSVGSSERLDYCESLGASGGVVRQQAIESLRDLGPFDVILDPVGGAYAALDIDLLREDGRVIFIGLMGGRRAELDLARVLSKRLQIIGSTLRSRSADFKAAIVADLKKRVWPHFSDGKLSACLERSFPAKDVDHAFALLGSNEVKGKLALILDDAAL